MAGGASKVSGSDANHIALPVDKLRMPNADPKSSGRKPPVVLVSTGSFNPPTILHLRMFELARDNLVADGYDVLGGYMSPVNDSYGKKGLLPSNHRIAMCQLATADSELVMVDTWEALQSEAQRGIKVLKRVENEVNAAIPQGLPPVRTMLLCGADLLESFCRPGVWIESQLREIFADHGVVCISRAGLNARKLVFENDLLNEYQRSIRVVDEWVANEVSSTLVRRFLSRGQSVKYLTPDPVIKYVKAHKLYGASAQEETGEKERNENGPSGTETE